MAGAVYLNKKRVKIASKPLFANARVEVWYDEKKVKGPLKSVSEANIGVQHIVYEDEYIIVINKPAGLPTQATLDDSRNNLIHSLHMFLKQREGHDVYLGVHHRLDADTSGLIMFTKKDEVNKDIAEMFREHLIQKKYLAVCTNEKEVPETWEIKNQLVRISPKKNKYKSTDTKEGSFAYTRFRVLQKSPEKILIEVTPVTGRTHQIRVHLAEYGLPILGDRIYGNKVAERLMLHAYMLEFRHPKNGKDMKLIAEPEQVFNI